jgi:CTD small phosphatase-like protein 2
MIEKRPLFPISPVLNRSSSGSGGSSPTFKLSPTQIHSIKIKVKKEVADKLNKILVHAQPLNASPANSSKAPKAIISQKEKSFNLNKADKPELQKLDFEGFSSYDITNKGISKPIRSPNKEKANFFNIRSTSHGRIRPINSTFLKDGALERFNMTPTPSKMERGFTPQNKLLRVQGYDITLDEKIARLTNDSSLIKSFESYPRQKSPKNFKQVDQDDKRNQNNADNGILARKSKSSAEINLIKPFKKNNNARWKNLLFTPNLDSEVLKNHLKIVTDGLTYAIKNIKPPSQSFVESRQMLLEKKTHLKKTLILDLDETLINCCELRDGPDMILVPIESSDTRIMIKVRPFTQQFLCLMKEHFEIIVFTASSELYAKTVVKALDPQMEYISYMFHRDYCMETDKGIRIKDLRIFKNRNLKDMIIVDNFVPAFSFQLENGVPILEWRGNRNDEELMYLTNYLIKAKDCDDMREYNRKNLGLLDLARTTVQAAAS